MKFNIITLGCKVNAYESNYISESLENNGFLFCEDFKEANIVIINTCTVTDTSDKKSLKMVRRVKRENPNAILVVCGCSSQNNKELYESLDIDILLGNKNKSKIVDIIHDYIEDKKRYNFINDERKIPFEDMFITKFNQVRAYIKIQDGCDNFCSYCIIPFVRGSIRFKDYDEILKEAQSLIEKGIKEIVLTGIHTGSYHFNDKDLTDLIYDLSKLSGLERLRLSSVEITELNDRFLEMLKVNKVFCDHLHVPLQSGCDKILKVMNRKYDTKYYSDKIAKIRSIVPDIAITTDVIVGHNYETEEDFEKTYSFCENIKFAKIHVFPYSKRTGTAASKMPEEVKEEAKKDRAKRLIALSEKLEKDYFAKFKGREIKVLIEEVKNGKSIGHTSNYLRLELNEILEVGKIYTRTIK